ncbi:MAG TPA: CHAT domain-containing protein [Chloroflexaceae bacterium]|nr:CHAT domain-containing protein [Chloroflexaceae bacterium]
MQTLRLTQSRLADDRYRIEVELLLRDGTSSTARGELTFALNDVEQADLRWYLERYLQYPFDPAPTLAAEVERRLEAIGAQLFRALFQPSDDARDIWAQIYRDLPRLRVEVVTDVREAASIPWELVRDPKTGDPLALTAHSFVRSKRDAARRPQLPAAEEGPVRVLLVISRPAAGEDVPFRSVASRLVKTLGEQARAGMELEVLRPPTFAELGRVLRAAKDRGEPYHVVHFDGHGSYQEARAESAGVSPHLYHDTRPGQHGYLLFEQPAAEGNLELVSGPRLGRLLFESSVPVLVLNACRSAYVEEGQGDGQLAAGAPPAGEGALENPHEQVRAFGSLAQEVMDAGVAGVVAMRYNVYVVTAAQYVAELYAHLAAGRSLGAAATLARKHLADDPYRAVASEPLPLQDWLVPVVYEAAPITLFTARDDGLDAQLGRIAADLQGARTALEAQALGLPDPPEVGFFGRDETLLALDRSFDTEHIVLLQAYAGSGKTATAAEFARWYQATGGVDGPVIFTSFERHLTLERALDAFGRVFDGMLKRAGLDWSGLEDPQRRELALNVMRRIELLWIWDNVEPVAGFPEGAPSAWSAEEQAALRRFLVEASGTKAKFLLTSRRDEAGWLGELPRRIKVPPMPLQERVQLARRIAERRGRRMGDVEDWMPLLRYSGGNPLALTVLVGQALRDGIGTRAQIETYVAKLRQGAASLDDDEREGRTRSLGASLSYGFSAGFSPEERRALALLHLFQGFVDVDALVLMGREDSGDLRFLREYGLDRAKGIGLLDRAADVGLLETLGGGYYRIHPALPWYFKDTFDAAFPPPLPPGSGQYHKAPTARRAQRAFVEAMGILGNYYHSQYLGGNQDIIPLLNAEEANLLQARKLARNHGWWDRVVSVMQGLLPLYYHTGQRAEWRHLVQEIAPHFCDPRDNGPLPGREEQWSLVLEYLVRIAREDRRLDVAEQQQLFKVEWARQRAAPLLARGARNLDQIERNQVRTLAVSIDILGDIQRDAGQPGCADSYQEALKLYEQLGDRMAAAVCMMTLGHAYNSIVELRDLDQAERWYRRSLELYNESQSHRRAKSIAALGSVALERFYEAKANGEPDETLWQHLKDSLARYQEALLLLPANANVDRAAVNNQIGITYHEAGNLDSARFHYDESIRYKELQGDLYGAGQTRYNLAITLYNAGQLARARRYAELALKNYEPYGAGAAQQIARTQRLLAAIDEALAQADAGGDGG